MLVAHISSLWDISPPLKPFCLPPTNHTCQSLPPALRRCLSKSFWIPNFCSPMNRYLKAYRHTGWASVVLESDGIFFLIFPELWSREESIEMKSLLVAVLALSCVFLYAEATEVKACPCKYSWNLNFVSIVFEWRVLFFLWSYKIHGPNQREHDRHQQLRQGSV